VGKVQEGFRSGEGVWAGEGDERIEAGVKTINRNRTGGAMQYRNGELRVEDAAASDMPVGTSPSEARGEVIEDAHRYIKRAAPVVRVSMEAGGRLLGRLDWCYKSMGRADFDGLMAELDEIEQEARRL
jgi:hypothetical protein